MIWSLTNDLPHLPSWRRQYKKITQSVDVQSPSLKMLEKLCLMFYFRRMSNTRNQKHHVKRMQKKSSVWCFRTFDHLISFHHFWINTQGWYTFFDSSGKPYVVFHHEKFALSNFGLDLCVGIVNMMVWSKIYFINLFRISFNKLLMCTSIMILIFWKLTISNTICDVCCVMHDTLGSRFFKDVVFMSQRETKVYKFGE